MRIAYLTAHDPHDVHYWSGCNRFIGKSLADRGIEMEFLAPLKVPWWVQKVCGVKRRFYTHFQRRFYWEEADLRAVRARSLAAFRRLQSVKPVDAVVAPGFLSCAFLPGDVPLVVYNDSTQKGLFATYPVHFNMAREHYANAIVLEKNTHRRASALVYSCDWAAQSAIKDYGASPAKVHVVPFGANLERVPAREEVVAAIRSRLAQPLRILFIGVDWHRKGGQATLETARALNAMGVPAQLTIIGCDAPLTDDDRKFTTCLGFISKKGEGLQRIQSELIRSHFLMVPSIADCSPIVYTEASAFGVPCIVRDVGGIATSVQNERNGRLFSAAATPSEIAGWIAAKFRDLAAYEQLALSTRAEHETNLNWDVAGSRLEKIIRDVVAKRKNGAA